MLDKFNLIASTYRRRENDLLSELWYFIRELGDNRVKAGTTGLPGLVVLLTNLDPFFVVEEAWKRALNEPWYFRFLLKIEPIELCVPTHIEEIKRAALQLVDGKLLQGEKYRIEVRKRLTTLTKEDVISSIAPYIPNKVDLENPDKILIIEIIGFVTGLAVVKPHHIVSIQKIRRASSTVSNDFPY